MAEETKTKKFGLNSIKAFFKIIMAAVATAIQTAVQEAISGLKTDLGSALTYKGSVDTYDELPKSDQAKGDTYNVNQAFENGGKKYPEGTNVAWNGSDWDPLGGSIDLSNYADKNYVTNATSDMATQTWVEEQDYLKEDDFEEYTEEEIQQAIQQENQ